MKTKKKKVKLFIKELQRANKNNLVELLESEVEFCYIDTEINDIGAVTAKQQVGKFLDVRFYIETKR